jgi:hypothetical protein
MIARIIPWEYVLGRTDVLTRGVLVLVGLLQSLVPLFDQICTRTLEMPMQWPELLPQSLGNHHNCLHHSLGVCIRKNICTRQGRVGLVGWVITAWEGRNGSNVLRYEVRNDTFITTAEDKLTLIGKDCTAMLDISKFNVFMTGALAFYADVLGIANSSG